MAMNYTLVNINANTATAVLVKNLMADTPTKPCGASSGTLDPTPEPTTEPTPAPTPAPSATPEFVYCAWQFLNPSIGAEELFAYNNILSVVIRKTSGSGTATSKRTPVNVGTSYMLVIGESEIQVVTDRANGAGYVEIETPTASVDPFTVNIEWYLSDLTIASGICVGITQNIGPNTSAFYQPDNGTLLFLPAAASSKTQTYAPGSVTQATAYQAPSYATKIGITLRADEAGAFSYTFDQPNALSG